MGKVYCSVSGETDHCPKCGAALTGTDYYTAVRGATSVVGKDVSYQGASRVTKTMTSTEYTNIERHWGDICLDCCRKTERRAFRIGLCLLIFGAINGLGAVIVALASDGLQELIGAQLWLFYGPAIAAALTLWIGWMVLTQCLLIPEEADAGRISMVFVKHAPRNHLPSSTVMLSSEMVKQMRQTGA